MWHQVHLLCQRLQPTPRAGHTCVKCARQTGYIDQDVRRSIRITYVRRTWNRTESAVHPSPICCSPTGPCATLFRIREIAQPGQKSAFLLRTLHQCPRLPTKFQASEHHAMTDTRPHTKSHTYVEWCVFKCGPGFHKNLQTILIDCNFGPFVHWKSLP